MTDLFDDEVEEVEETPEEVAPVGPEIKTYQVPQTEIQAAQFGRLDDAPMFVEWGDGSIRFDTSFLYIHNDKGGGYCYQGDYVIKQGGYFYPVAYAEFEARGYLAVGDPR